MTFPTTSILVDFTTQPDGGPPPTANFGAGLFGAGDMVVDTGLCIPDPANADPTLGDAPYTARTFSLPAEVWAILGPVAVDDFASVYVTDVVTTLFLFQWVTSGGETYFSLLDAQGPVNLWTSGLNQFAPLVEGGGLGVRANDDGSIECWITYDGSSWTKIHTETGLSIPNPATIGLASFAGG